MKTWQNEWGNCHEAEEKQMDSCTVKLRLILKAILKHIQKPRRNCTSTE